MIVDINDVRWSDYLECPTCDAAAGQPCINTGHGLYHRRAPHVPRSRDLRDRAALTYACPDCRARPGQWCRTWQGNTGKKAKSIHILRYHADDPYRPANPYDKEVNPEAHAAREEDIDGDESSMNDDPVHWAQTFVIMPLEELLDEARETLKNVKVRGDYTDPIGDREAVAAAVSEIHAQLSELSTAIVRAAHDLDPEL